MFEVLCAIAVIYVAVDLLGSAYLVRRFGGIRATIQQIRYQQGWVRDDHEDDTCDCGCSDDC